MSEQPKSYLDFQREMEEEANLKQKLKRIGIPIVSLMLLSAVVAGFFYWKPNSGGATREVTGNSSPATLVVKDGKLAYATVSDADGIESITGTQRIPYRDGYANYSANFMFKDVGAKSYDIYIEGMFDVVGTVVHVDVRDLKGNTTNLYVMSTTSGYNTGYYEKREELKALARQPPNVDQAAQSASRPPDTEGVAGAMLKTEPVKAQGIGGSITGIVHNATFRMALLDSDRLRHITYQGPPDNPAAVFLFDVENTSGQELKNAQAYLYMFFDGKVDVLSTSLGTLQPWKKVEAKWVASSDNPVVSAWQQSFRAVKLAAPGSGLQGEKPSVAAFISSPDSIYYVASDVLYVATPNIDKAGEATYTESKITRMYSPAEHPLRPVFEKLGYLYPTSPP